MSVSAVLYPENPYSIAHQSPHEDLTTSYFEDVKRIYPPRRQDIVEIVKRNSSLEEEEEWSPERNATQRHWISGIMAQVLPSFVPWSSTNEECTKQGILYRNDLANLTFWAVQMLDSSAVAEIGLLSGNEFNSGNYDQCIQVKVPEYNIVGKHCLANIQISPTYFNINESQGIFEYKQLSPLSPVWNKIRKVTDDRIKRRDRFYWAICIPSACTHTDLQESLSKALVPAFKENGINIVLTVEERDCEVEENNSLNFSPGAYAFFIVTAAFVLTVIIATIFHTIYLESYAEEKEDGNVLLMFSIISNTNRLLKPEAKTEYRFISGLKVLSMFLIIYGHRMLMSMYWPLSNAENQEKMFDTFLQIINLNGPIIVNTFLLTTGFLIFNKLLTDIKKNRTINIPIYIFYRWARATPVYIFVLCLFIFVKPLYINEPLYKREGRWRLETCTENFWTYILYINNYYKANTECILPAWYLAVDMQLYIVCVITGYIMSKSKKCGYVLLGFLLGVALVMPGVVTYFQGYDSTLRLYLNFLDNYYENREYVNSYIPTHMRAGPYVMGMLTAVILMKLIKRNYQFTLFQRIIGVSVSIVMGIGSLVYAWIFYIPERDSSLLENGLYVIIHRFAWSICISWIILAGIVNGYGKVSAILGGSIYGPLNKLTLNALLIHTLVQGQTFLTQRYAENIDLFIILWKTCGDIMLTYILSYILHLIIEAPLARLQDFGLRKLFGKTK